MKRKKPTREQMTDLIIGGLMHAETEDDLETINDLAEAAVESGIMTQDEVDALWDDFAPSIES